MWSMVVGPPGSIKTELMSGLNEQPNVRFVDQITPQTFISGQIRQKGDEGEGPADSSTGWGRKAYSSTPFSTILGMKAEARASILADMRRIYDGEFDKEFGTADSLQARVWKGRITFVVAATRRGQILFLFFQTLTETVVVG